MITNAAIMRSLQQLHLKVDIVTEQQDEINADVAELTAAVGTIQAEIAALQAANPTLDLTALKSAVDAVAAIAPPAA
jgi:predicted negative regulator of RcsB-dependent stress response